VRLRKDAATLSTPLWLAVGLIGAFVVVAWPLLSHLYWIERAGGLLDRAIVSSDAGALLEAGRILGLDPNPEAPRAFAPPPEPGAAGDTPDYWRTYGAVAARTPSESAFHLLLRARDRGVLDRMGRLWLAEIAEATGHWGIAAEEYARVDAINLLVDRGDDALTGGRLEEARGWYESAAAGLLAADDVPRPNGDDGSSLGGLFDVGAGRTIFLLRVGWGLLQTAGPEAALPVLERAESEIQVYPPGVSRQQAVRFTLAEALAQTMPTDPEAAGIQKARIDTLISRAVTAEESGWSRLQEARVRLEIDDRTGALQALRAAVRLDPASTEARLTLGLLMEQDGLLSLARDQYARGLEYTPDDPRLLVAHAKAAYLTKSPAASLPGLLVAAGTDTQDPALFAYLGDCLFELGDLPRARAAYREGLRRDPGNSHLARRLERLPPLTGHRP
jgi:tetratricopeptide (TPR) repeat protein